MKLILKKLVLSSFKNVSGEFVFDEGRNVFKGDNRTGKTTLADSVQWLLFGKDSQGKSEFEIKQITDGKPIEKADHEVQAVLTKDGETINLKRVFYENWVKKRGSLNPTFQGNKTDFFIDGVKKAKKDYELFVEELIPSDMFKMLTDPRFFPLLPWEKKRSVLLELSGDIDREAIAEKTGFKALVAGRTAEDAKAVAAEKRKQIRQQLEEIPARIDEKKRSIGGSPALGAHLTLEKAQDEVSFAQTELNQARERLLNFEQNSNQEINQKITSLIKEIVDEEMEFAKKKDIASSDQNKRNARVTEMQYAIENLEKKKTNLRDQANVLRAKFKTVKEEKAPEDNTCPHCSQPLPETMIQKALDSFNVMKSKKLEGINEEGKRIVSEIERIDADITAKMAEVQRLQQLPAPEILSILAPDSVVQKKQELENLRVELSEKVDAVPDEIKTAVSSAEKVLTEAQETLACVRNRSGDLKRIKQLEDEMNFLTEEFNANEKVIDAIEQYNRAIAEETEKAINGLFSVVTFRMFKEQINGGIKECCDILGRNGVPYDTGLNNADQINAGLDIIKTLSGKYGMFPPIFIDNAEAVTKLFQMDTQTVELHVSEEHKKLTKIG